MAADGAPTHLWGTTQDVTRQKLATLADERYRKRLEMLNYQLEQFAGIASHDLLEPLRKVRFFAGVVVSESSNLTPSASDALRRLNTTTSRMEALVHDLLAFTRAGKTLAQTRPVRLDEVLDEVLDTLDDRIRECGAVVRREPLPTVLGDQILLVQVFQNLLSNSLRYRDPHRQCEIRVTCQVDSRIAAVSVRDNGLGFPVGQEARLFEPFVRLHPELPGGGAGLGLAICRRIIEAHGGTIDAAPGAASGAVFTCTLPLAARIGDTYGA